MAPPRKIVSMQAARSAKAVQSGDRSPDTKAAKHAAEIIRFKILDGLLSPGQRLIEPDLMTELDVGRSTIREAFLKLDAEGFVELRHQRGAIVRRLTRRDMAELFEVRERLEGLAAALCAARVDQGGNRARLRAMRELWMREDLRSNSLKHMEENVDLHASIIAMGGNQRLIRMLEPLQIPGYRIQFLQLLDDERRVGSAAEHIAIIDALLAGDAGRAERLMREHVRRAGKIAQLIPGLLD
jgi:DNA-binding GntR family transcriptional regulator